MAILLTTKFLSAWKYPVCNIQKRCVALFWRKKKVQDQPFLVVRATPDDHCCILQQMWNHYYPQEPTTVALGLGHKHNPVLDDHAMQALAEGLSIIAKCKYTGEIVGAAVNKTICPWDPDLMDRLACTFSSDRLRQLYHFYAYVMRAPCLFDLYCTNKIFEISQVFVRKADRCKGICRLLIETSANLGADCGYRVIRVDATSAFTAKTCDKLKLKLAHEIPYCSYTGIGPAHEPIFKPPPPHCSCKVYVHAPFLVES